jgi:hypothetical protein
MQTIQKISVVYNAIPLIVVEYIGSGDSATGTQRQEIEFDELGKYIALLEQQQADLGDTVTFEKGTYSINNKDFPAVTITATA